MLRDSYSGIVTFKPSSYTIEYMKSGDSQPFYWPSGRQVRADELVEGKTYFVDENDRTLIEP